MNTSYNDLNSEVKTLKAYEVLGDSDCEGRGPRYVVGYFLSHDVAKRAARGQGASGTEGYVNPVDVIAIALNDGKFKYYLDKPIELKYESDEDIRLRALSKLTQEEKRVLRLK